MVNIRPTHLAVSAYAPKQAEPLVPVNIRLLVDGYASRGEILIARPGDGRLDVTGRLRPAALQ